MKSNRKSYSIPRYVLRILETLTKSSPSLPLSMTAMVSQHTRVQLSSHFEGKCVIPENLATWYVPLDFPQKVLAARQTSSSDATPFKRLRSMWGRLCDSKCCYKTGDGNQEIVLHLIQIFNSHLPKLGCGNGELHIFEACAFLEEVFLKLVARVFEKDLLEVIQSTKLISQSKIRTINILDQYNTYSRSGQQML